MGQILTVCRIERDWAVRDVTGNLNGRTTDLAEARRTAERMSKRWGAVVSLSDEALAQLVLRKP
ncbi:hypothetical protein C8D03_0965 [Bosea sp. 124]|nr:hypothetical protein C8D03_0965 [Bosea sp. 124]